MENVATSVRINAAASAVLSAIAERTGKSKAQIIEEALRQLEDRIFWAEVQAAFAEPETKAARAERELWESTVGDGLREAW